MLICTNTSPSAYSAESIDRLHRTNCELGMIAGQTSRWECEVYLEEQLLFFLLVVSKHLRNRVFRTAGSTN